MEMFKKGDKVVVKRGGKAILKATVHKYRCPDIQTIGVKEYCNLNLDPNYP
jgi:hypothetical protein